jgi:hypothetical protein
METALWGLMSGSEAEVRGMKAGAESDPFAAHHNKKSALHQSGNANK